MLISHTSHILPISVAYFRSWQWRDLDECPRPSSDLPVIVLHSSVEALHTGFLVKPCQRGDATPHGHSRRLKSSETLSDLETWAEQYHLSQVGSFSTGIICLNPCICTLWSSPFFPSPLSQQFLEAHIFLRSYVIPGNPIELSYIYSKTSEALKASGFKTLLSFWLVCVNSGKRNPIHGVQLILHFQPNFQVYLSVYKEEWDTRMIFLNSCAA